MDLVVPPADTLFPELDLVSRESISHRFSQHSYRHAFTVDTQQLVAVLQAIAGQTDNSRYC
ncbi:MAG: hypothetical protein IPL70_08760 [Uliginosibacterium sp.]|nr:hypothetical protein [Uliginosibacterium sp.]